MEEPQLMNELSGLVAALAGDYYAGKLSPEEAAEFDAIKERIQQLEEKARARLNRSL
jgi:hypothetical protein